MPRAVLFDLDGTLVESLPGIATALNRALESRGRPAHPASAVRRFIGNGSRMLCRRAAPDLPETAIDALEAQFLHEYAIAWREGTAPFAGIEQLLDELHADGIPLALLSNKPHRFTVEIVGQLFPRHSFAAILGHQPGAPRKPDPAGALEIAASLHLAPTEILFVGDSTVDHETAHRAGMPTLLVDWGYHDRPVLEATGAPVVSAAHQVRRFLAAPHRGA